MGTLLNRRRYMGVGEEGIVPISYLESSGTQYIELPVTAAAGTYFEVGGEVIAIHPFNLTHDIFSANPVSQCYASFYQFNNNAITFGSTVGGKPASGGFVLPVGTKETFALSTTFKRVGEVTTANSRPLTAAINSFRLFGTYRSSAGLYPLRVCSWYIKVGTDVLYDLVAVRVGSVGYLMDTLTGTLYGNAGSGDFILGTDL